MKKTVKKAAQCLAVFFLVIAWTQLVVSDISYASEEKGTLEVLKGIELNGFVSGAYSYNFNGPSDSKNGLRVFDTDDNSIKLDVAEFVVQKGANDPGSAGFRFDLNYGYSVPGLIHSSGYNGSDDFDLQQAYVSYNAPVGNGLVLDLGKFITHMGAEVIEGYDGWNYNYSRSFLFGYAIPFTHTGLRATYVFNDTLSFMGMVANGWDNVVDNNDGKTLGAQIGITPAKNISLLLNYVGGPAQDNRNGSWRNVFDVVFTVNPVDRLTVQLNYDYGMEKEGALAAGTGSGGAKWQGIAGVVRYDFTERFSLNVRSEFFKDNDGVRTGVSQELWEITLTPEFVINKNFVLRPEYRHDASNVPVFNNNGKTRGVQDTIAINAMFYF